MRSFLVLDRQSPRLNTGTELWVLLPRAAGLCPRSRAVALLKASISSYTGSIEETYELIVDFELKWLSALVSDDPEADVPIKGFP